MPRDLFPAQPTERGELGKQEKKVEEEEAQLYRSPDQEAPSRSCAARYSYDDSSGYPHARNKEPTSDAMKKVERRNDLHPYVATLSLADVESCVKLEAAAFPEHERCSKEKVRLSRKSSKRETFPLAEVQLDFYRLNVKMRWKTTEISSLKCTSLMLVRLLLSKPNVATCTIRPTLEIRTRWKYSHCHSVYVLLYRVETNFWNSSSID